MQFITGIELFPHTRICWHFIIAGVLLAVAIGVAMGVVIGGIMLCLLTVYMKR